MTAPTAHDRLTDLPATDTPLVSIVTATHNREDRLAMLLDGLRRQTLAAERFEIVVVDDGSTDGTAALLEREAERGDLRLTFHALAKAGGPAGARNVGWRSATAPLIAFTDDDCVPTPGWLEALLETSRSGANVLVQGPTRPLPEESQHLGPYSRTVEITAASPHYETCNIAYPRALLEQLGGFDETYPAPAGEDSDLGWRAVTAGAELRFAPAALVHHAVHQRGPLAALRDVRLATEGVQAYKTNAELRQYLPQGIFYRRSHALFLEAALAVFLARRCPPALAFALPYAMHVRSRARRDRAKASATPFYVAFDAAEIAATVRGAVRYRVPIV
jgi:glycosyltransferase involved in cell wall biosynthesis